MTDESLLRKVAAQIGAPPSYAGGGVKGSILTVAAASYGARPTTEEITQPTGFDPQAAALFEAVVEAAFLVANADGEFDDTERDAFQHVVLAACQGTVAEGQVAALLADLADQLDEDGLDKRVSMVGRTINKPEHAREVLRVAALLAQVSGGVSESERSVLAKLASEFQLGTGAVDTAIGEVSKALAD